MSKHYQKSYVRVILLPLMSDIMNRIHQHHDAYNFKMFEIYNFDTGKVEQADAWLNQDNETIIKLRYALRANKKAYGCPSCKTGVELKKTKKGIFFFKHNEREEGVKCALIDEMSYTEKRIQQYNASKEAEEHEKLKDFINDYLKIDPDVIGDPEVEKIVKGKVALTTWKRPDVKCNYKHQDMVFEIQISNTLLSDIVAKDSFYKKEKVAIVWIFNQFDPAQANLNLTQADIFYNNPEANAFVLDEAAMKASKEGNQLMLTCHYRVPSINFETMKIDIIWNSSLVALEDLQIDKETFKPYVFPFYRKLNEVKEALIAQLDEEERKLEKEKAYLGIFKTERTEVARKAELLESERGRTQDEQLRQKKEAALLLQLVQTEKLNIQRAEAAERDKKMKEEWLEKAAENRLARIADQRQVAEQKRMEADKIENKYPKKFRELTTAQCVELIFKNKLSRDLLNLNRRLAELRELGFDFPDNILNILEKRRSIAKMQGMFSQTQFQRASGY